MTANRPTRLFRAQTAHDVACAAIVATQLVPGLDILAVSTDKTLGDPAPQLEAMCSLAHAHRWEAVIDLSGLPIGTHWLGRDGLRRLMRAVETKSSARECRRRLASPLGLDSADPQLRAAIDAEIDELYINCLNHADIQMLYHVARSADKVYLPHGFDCLQESEIHYYAPDFAPAPRGVRAAVFDAAKRLLFGPDAVPLRGVTLDRALTFNLNAPWAPTTRLDGVITSNAMAALFRHLSASARRYFHDAGNVAGDGAGLLVLTPSNLLPLDRLHLELQVYADTVRYLQREVGVHALLVKPHPRASDAWNARVIDHLRAAADGLRLIPLTEHAAYPIEIVASVLRLAACAGFGSSSLRTLSQLYAIPAFCPDTAFKRLLESSPRELAAWRAWASADHGPRFVAI